ncbi:sodium/proton antiporter, CPA1 family [Roseovarius pacificus]|uniref:Sodium/proton antiporter, CPA1 family n=1 Tax=Roseovarius pacificus TaxID=337701 RepID=A0A1M6X486_9RHOB|nr:sodium:proton antiporter [Roseovarius pacificus]GGO52584.1 sodium/hydrogen exchanger [Roseovarius pacificus]SHL00827.1 sodium/proton antiporter, CPA1 family [Roseovarius pacificus]
MAMEAAADGALAPVMSFALVGVLGVGAQWAAWRLRMPAIVLMLVAGLLIGPVLGVFDPARDIGPLMGPMIAIAVAIILFEGGLTLNVHSLRGAAEGVRRLIFPGAPLGWLFSALALHYVAGLSWASSAVFGGIMIVTGPTVIAPLLRQARLNRRPAQLLQWEAIVNDPIGALAAVLAFEVVLVLNTSETMGTAIWDMARGIVVAAVMGIAAGWIVAEAFRRAWVPEYMKVPVLFATLLMVFALSDSVLHESGLLAVTVMGIWIANADLPSYTEMRRFKEHATILLVSGVFILLAANMDFDRLAMLDWRALIFILSVIFVVRPLTVLLSLAGTRLPFRERLLVGLTGPRGVVLVAVAGLFAERLVASGVEDAALLGPLAFALVAATVVLHGFSLRPLAAALGLAGKGNPGVIIVGGSRFAAAFAEALQKREVPVLIADANRARLRSAREAGLPVFFGDILSEAAEHGVEIMSYGRIMAVSDNDAYNTLVATDLAPEFGRDNVFQLRRAKQESRRHALPSTLGGRAIAGGLTYLELASKMSAGWKVRATNLTEEFTFEDWRSRNPEAVALAEHDEGGELRLIPDEGEPRKTKGTTLLSLAPKTEAVKEGAEGENEEKAG